MTDNSMSYGQTDEWKPTKRDQPKKEQNNYSTTSLYVLYELRMYKFDIEGLF